MISELTVSGLENTSLAEYIIYELVCVSILF